MTVDIETLRRRRGPFVIVGRPHSGTRAVTMALMRAGVFCGAEITPGFLDSEIWFARFVLPLLSDPRMPGLLEDPKDASAQALIEERLSDTLERHFDGHDVADPRPWGWKLSETLFLMRELQAVFPGARFVHVIRDGRDVVLSDDGRFQLTNRPPARRTLRRLAGKVRSHLTSSHQRFARRYDYNRFCEYITFGRNGVDRWRGVDLRSDSDVIANRYLLQMKSWVHCVETARQMSKTLGGAYMELRYEDFCREPNRHAESMFNFLGIDPPREAVEGLAAQVSTARVGKWRRWKFASPAEEADFASAVALGADLLHDLGYETDERVREA